MPNQQPAVPSQTRVSFEISSGKAVRAPGRWASRGSGVSNRGVFRQREFRISDQGCINSNLTPNRDRQVG